MSNIHPQIMNPPFVTYPHASAEVHWLVSLVDERGYIYLSAMVSYPRRG